MSVFFGLSYEYDKILNEFLADIKKNYSYYSNHLSEIIDILADMERIIKAHPDNPEDVLDEIIQETIIDIEHFKKKYQIPGYNINLSVGNVGVQFYGGNMSSFGEPMKSDALFDIASITKMYTTIVAINMIQDGYFDYDTKIKDIAPQFVNVDDLTIGELLEFSVTFITPGRIDDKKTLDQAFDCLYNVTIKARNKYNYNDIGMMILKEVMESSSEESYEDLVKRYIFDPLGLKNSFIVVPDSEISRVTGTPNLDAGLANDAKAILLGGHSGHAGAFSSTGDLNKVGDAILDGTLLPTAHFDKIILPNKDNGDRSAFIGSLFVKNPSGENNWERHLCMDNSFTAQGSTRISSRYSKFNTSDGTVFSKSTIGLNPSSMSYEEAMELQKIINEDRTKRGLPTINVVKHYDVYENGIVRSYTLIDPRQFVPAADMGKINDSSCKLEIRMLFLNEFMKKYHNLKEHINVVQSIKTK